MRYNLTKINKMLQRKNIKDLEVMTKEELLTYTIKMDKELLLLQVNNTKMQQELLQHQNTFINDLIKTEHPE